MANECDHVIVLGDFNAPGIDWSNEVAESSGSFDEDFLTLSHSLALHQLVSFPTRFRDGQAPSALDLVFCRYTNDVDGVCMLPPLGKSDHAIVQFRLNMYPVRPQTKTRRCFSKVVPEKVTLDAQALNWTFQPNLTVDQKWCELKTQVSYLLNAHAPLKPVPKGRKKPWFNHGIRRTLE